MIATETIKQKQKLAGAGPGWTADLVAEGRGPRGDPGQAGLQCPLLRAPQPAGQCGDLWSQEQEGCLVAPMLRGEVPDPRGR